MTEDSQIQVRIHRRVIERHPDIREDDVINAWNNFVRRSRRMDGDEEYCAAVGFDGMGRLIEMAAVQAVDGDWLVYHTLTPPTKIMMTELGLIGR